MFHAKSGANGHPDGTQYILSGAHPRGAIEMPGAVSLIMPMHAVYRKEAPPGPAGRWLIHSLKRRAGTES